MKKMFTLFIALTLWAGSSLALVNGYTFTGSSGVYTPISGGVVLGTISNDDQVFNASTIGASPPVTSTGFPIGFNFTYNGNVYDRFAVNTNGWILLGTGTFTIAGSTSPISVTGPAGFASAISALGMDLQGQTGSELSWKTEGVSPNMVLTVQWTGYRSWNATGDNYNFQIKLYESSNEVRFWYGQFTKNTTARNAQVGIRGATNSDFHNRATASNWAATSKGTLNTETCTLSQTVLPGNGLIFVFNPLPTLPGCANNVSPADLLGNIPITATLNWSAGSGGAPTYYRLYFGTNNPPTNIVNGTNLGLVTTYDPTPDLLYMTDYYWKIVPGNTQGEPIGCPIWKFTTGPDPTIILFPYCESFDGVDFAPYGWTNKKTAGSGTPGIWDRQTSGTYPTCAPYSGAGMARYSCYSLSSGTAGILVTPPINLPSDLYRVTFWMYRDSGYPGYSNEVVNVFYNTSPTSTGGTLLGTIHRSYSLSPPEAVANEWYPYYFDLPPGSGGPGRYIGFEAVSQYGNNIFLDDVCVVEQPLCPAPVNLTASNITTNSADIGWSSPGSYWDVEYGAVPYLFTGTPTFSTTSNPYPLGGLTANTSYAYKVRNVCVGGLYSTWSGPYVFTTMCNSVALPYSENFDGVVAPAIPPCMTVTNDNGDGVKWTTYATNPLSSPNSMSIGFSTSLAMNDWFFSPGLNLTAGVNYTVKFWYRAQLATYPEKLQVLWGTSPSAAGMTGGTIWDNPSVVNTTYAADSGTFTPPANGVYYVGWHGYSNVNMYRLYVDDVSVKAGAYINAGTDKYTVSAGTLTFGTSGSDYPPLPAGFFGPGSMPFEGTIFLQGHHSNGSKDPDGDVSINRTVPLAFGSPPSVGTVPTEMTQLSLSSSAPILVQYDVPPMQPDSFFDVFFEIPLSGVPPMGTSQITLQNQYGGMFLLNQSVQPVITFVNTMNPSEVYTFDPEGMGRPALSYSSTVAYPWTLSPIPGQFDPLVPETGEEELKLLTPSGSSISLAPLLERDDNNFMVEMNENAVATMFHGNGFNDGQFYYYPNTNWWNVWWYDHPIRTNRMKYILRPVMNISPRLTSLNSSVEIVYTYSTPQWYSWVTAPRPPLPSDVPTLTQENLMIQRSPSLFSYSGEITSPIPVPLTTPYILPYYNPEWMSVDIRGYNFYLSGLLNHVCFRPATPSVDFGDAPQPYPTLLLNNGARHTIVAGVFMGNLIDAEADGQPNANATGDDIAPPLADDEDGVTFNTPLNPGQVATLTVKSSMANALLQGWIDFNADGDWADAGEQIMTNLVAVAGNNVVNFNVPAGAKSGLTFARFRLSTMPNLTYTGLAPNGEVEDYQVNIETMQQFDFGDAPDPTYPTLLASNGARHIVTGLKLGTLIDAEPNGQPNATATGDDNNNLNDEDGIWWGCDFIPGQVNTIKVTASGPGFLNAWFDFNIDGDWADPGEQVFTNVALLAGTTDLFVNVPAGASLGNTFARFRFSSQQNLSYTGLAQDGEVEDYMVTIHPPEEMDYGDAPDPTYPTLAASNGARHRHDPNIPLFLGNKIDWEINGQPNPLANGDDMNNLSDEDGVIFLTPMLPGGVATINVTASMGGGALQGWIDFNQNGTWDPTEQIFTNTVLVAGVQLLTFNVPPNALLGKTYARFRYSTMGNLMPYGCAPNGEVEDYMIYIGDYDLGDAPDPSYPTLLASNGAIHKKTGLYMGVRIDAEPNGQPNATATGDDTNPPGLNDEDGVWWPCNFVPGQVNTVKVTTSGPGFLNAWIDYNIDGDWSDQGEQVFTNVALPLGTTDLFVAVPPTASFGTTIARFRFSTQQNLSYTGYASDGEVEDYTIVIQPTQEMEYGDLPDPPYPTLAASNGARHAHDLNNPIPIFLGNLIDWEMDGLPSPNAKGDDLNAIPDEDGVIFNTPLIPGMPALITVTASMGGGAFQAWIDYNHDGDFMDAGEQVFTNLVLIAGPQPLNFIVPQNALLGNTYARFRYSTMANLMPYGCAPNGEVEDYAVFIGQPETYDYGDAPDPTYPTLLINNGARHLIDNVTYLGSLIDAEIDGQPSALATGDDFAGLDDEDGVTFMWPLSAGIPCKLKVKASVGDALFNCWIDYNGNGSWAEPNEHVFVDRNLLAGDNYLTFIPPRGIHPGTTYARFRFSHQPALSFNGTAYDGEVEDYAVNVTQYTDTKWQQLPDTLLPGLHATDGNILADDWVCNGEVVTDVHWWGNYEMGPTGGELRRLGINHFQLNIYSSSNCLPNNIVKSYMVPFVAGMEIPTGLINNEGSPIYRYDFLLPEPFIQVKDSTYWLSIQAISNDVQNPPSWRWQDANRWLFPILCGAANNNGIWQTITWPFPPLVKFEDLAFRMTSWRVDSLNLQNIDVVGGQNICYDANKVIIVAGGGTTFTVYPGGSATMIAGERIAYLYGTTVKSGGYMRGSITTTGEFCNWLKTSLVANAITEPEDKTPPELIIQNAEFKVYPNPTTGEFIIELSAATETNEISVEIYSMLGTRVFSKKFEGSTKSTVSLASQQPGIYILHVTTGKETRMVKIIKL